MKKSRKIITVKKFNRLQDRNLARYVESHKDYWNQLEREGFGKPYDPSEFRKNFNEFRRLPCTKGYVLTGITPIFYNERFIVVLCELIRHKLFTKKDKLRYDEIKGKWIKVN